MLMLRELLSLANQYGTFLTLGLALVARLVVLASPKRSAPRKRFRFAFSLCLVHLMLLLVATILTTLALGGASGARVGVALTATLASVTLGSVALFEGLVRRVRPGLPRIVP